MSNFGPLSTMAYAAVVTWAFWRFATLGGGPHNMASDIPPLAVFMLCTVAARVFAMMIHHAAMRGQA